MQWFVYILTWTWLRWRPLGNVFSNIVLSLIAIFRKMKWGITIVKSISADAIVYFILTLECDFVEDRCATPWVLHSRHEALGDIQLFAEERRKNWGSSGCTDFGSGFGCRTTCARWVRRRPCWLFTQLVITYHNRLHNVSWMQWLGLRHA